MRSKQRGYIDISAGAIALCMWLAAFGALCGVAGACWLVYYVATHLHWA